MEKKYKLRGSTPAKVVACLLAVLLLAGSCMGLMLGANFYYRWQYVWDFNVQWEELCDAKAEDIGLYLFLSLYEDALTIQGQEEYASLQEQLSTANTNLRFKITDQDGQRVLSNLSETVAGSNNVQYSVELYSYELGYDQPISYYLNLAQVTDWEKVYGSESDWANTEYASSYYYDNENYETVEEETGDVAATEDTTVTEEDTDVAFTVEVSEDDSSQQYYYYVYTGELTEYTLTMWVDENYPVDDDFSLLAQEQATNVAIYSEYCRPALLVGGISLLLFAVVLTWLTWSMGWDRSGTLALRRLNRMPGEMALALLGAAVCAMSLLAIMSRYDLTLTLIAVGVGLSLGGAVCWVAGWCALTVQLKTHRLRANSIIFRLWTGIHQWGRRLVERGRSALAQWPLYWKVLLALAVYALLQFLWSFAIVDTIFWGEIGLFAFIINTLPLVPLALFACKWAVDFSKLRSGAKKLVEGQLDYRIDDQHMLPDLRDHARELSQISEGLSHAVDERVKSQRFKTELITNVSHDLKTPLTSIINYVDLLKKLDIQNETARGYIDVLDRKSQRLKTLTEDLVEASKAASGAISVELERLDLSQLVRQAAAEYEDRLEHAALTPMISTPEQPCMVLADGRHLWRVLDNLLGNCTKYAMPGTRVYLDVAAVGETGVVTVKNISADPLNVPAEELMKRFVRGDSSRTTEGSGLGLSIARNLTNVQHGSFDLVVDGDLFKVMISLPLASETAVPEAPAAVPPAPDAPEPDGGGEQEP